MAEYKLKRGYDIRLEGEADKEIVTAPEPAKVAIKPVEFRGIKPRLSVEEGDAVKIGSPLFYAKGEEAHRFSSPASGKVVAINRGHRRVITSIVIERDGKNDAESFPSYELGQIKSLDREAVLKDILDAGLLGVFIQRPFGNTADPKVTPRDIFVTAFDSGPLAPDTALMIDGNETFFQAGLLAASKLTSGKVHVAIDGRADDASGFFVDDEKVVIHKFQGPHPSGCVGVQIHHISPITGRDDNVWAANLQGIILLGRLFLEGRVAPERIVAVAGSAATSRKYFRTVLGVPAETLVGADMSEQQVRFISGNVLTGKKIGKDGFVGYHDHLVTVIPEATEPEFIGWMLPGADKESFYRAFVSRLIPGRKFAKDTRLGGGHRAMVATGYYEQVTPMDILPMFLLKAILVEDFEEIEGLGIYEVLEEDLALCEYICPSKTEVQDILRRGLDLVEKEG